MGTAPRVGACDVQPLLDLDLPALPESPSRARHEVRAAVAGLAVDAAAIQLAVSEAVTNAVVHAYRDREPGRVQVTLAVRDDGVSIAVSDRGVGMSPRPDSPGFGVGLPLIANVCDDFAIHQRTDGTSVEMRFRFTEGRQAADE